MKERHVYEGPRAAVQKDEGVRGVHALLQRQVWDLCRVRTPDAERREGATGRAGAKRALNVCATEL